MTDFDTEDVVAALLQDVPASENAGNWMRFLNPEWILEHKKLYGDNGDYDKALSALVELSDRRDKYIKGEGDLDISDIVNLINPEILELNDIEEIKNLDELDAVTDVFKRKNSKDMSDLWDQLKNKRMTKSGVRIQTLPSIKASR